MGKIAVGIVLYNPDKLRLQLCIDSVLTQTNRLYVFDNSDTAIEIPISSAITYKTEKMNQGIAYALNQIMSMAKKDGYEWVVTMDQDSILPEGIIADYEINVSSDKGLGIICPQVIDKRRCYMSIKTEPEKDYLSECITSASCTSISAWESVGKFDEWLFIDLVDNEFCKRLVVSGYKILRLNRWVVDQEFGKIIPKSERQQRFWINVSKLLNNENFAKFSYKKQISPMRVYYTNRNIIYVNKKLKKYGKTAYQNYNCKGYIGFIISFSIPSFLRAQKKRKVFMAIIKGISDGCKKKVTPWCSHMLVS